MAEKINSMREIKIEKVVLNCGGIGDKLDKSAKLLKMITGKNAVRTTSNKRIPDFGVRPGLEIGCKITLTGKEAIDLLKKLMQAKNNSFLKRQFNEGTFSFGIPEYIEIPGVNFQREIGMLGLDVNVKFKRAGFSIDKKKIKSGKIPNRHKISKEETIEFMEKNFQIKLTEKK
jgi:large subunit ribosomal protein L5